MVKKKASKKRAGKKRGAIRQVKPDNSEEKPKRKLSLARATAIALANIIAEADKEGIQLASIDAARELAKEAESETFEYIDGQLAAFKKELAEVDSQNVNPARLIKIGQAIARLEKKRAKLLGAVGGSEQES